MLADRLATGVELYKSGKVDKLPLSGDHGRKDYDEVNAMLGYCLARGVPDKDVFTDHAGFDTYDTMYRARDVFKVSDALVVTQSFHLPRAVETARAPACDWGGRRHPALHRRVAIRLANGRRDHRQPPAPPSRLLDGDPRRRRRPGDPG
jgi:vancomycin permeability regulator SanA